MNYAIRNRLARILLLLCFRFLHPSVHSFIYPSTHSRRWFPHRLLVNSTSTKLNFTSNRPEVGWLTEIKFKNLNTLSFLLHLLLFPSSRSYNINFLSNCETSRRNVKKLCSFFLLLLAMLCSHCGLFTDNISFMHRLQRIISYWW